MHYLNFAFIIALFVAPSYQAGSYESFCIPKEQNKLDIWSNNCHQSRICYKGHWVDFLGKTTALTSNAIGDCNRGTWNLSWEVDKRGEFFFVIYGGQKYRATKDMPMAKKYGYQYCATAFVKEAGLSC